MYLSRVFLQNNCMCTFVDFDIFSLFFSHKYRYEAILMRARFDATRKEKDLRKLAAMLEAGEEEWFEKQAYDPFIFRDDEHGIIYNREPHYRDELIDHWHPWEKVRYFHRC